MFGNKNSRYVGGSRSCSYGRKVAKYGSIESIDKRIRVSLTCDGGHRLNSKFRFDPRDYPQSPCISMSRRHDVFALGVFLERLRFVNQTPGKIFWFETVVRGTCTEIDKVVSQISGRRTFNDRKLGVRSRLLSELENLPTDVELRAFSADRLSDRQLLLYPVAIIRYDRLASCSFGAFVYARINLAESFFQPIVARTSTFFKRDSTLDRWKPEDWSKI